MYQLEKDDASEYSANVIHGIAAVQNSASSSKMSIAAGQTIVIIENRRNMKPNIYLNRIKNKLIYVVLDL